MSLRAKTSAATREALLRAAAGLLDTGGTEAVTMREVGARAGVSRSALYRHFSGKEALLTELVTRAWTAIGDALGQLQERSDLSPRRRIHDGFTQLVALAQTHPYLYELMFGTPPLRKTDALDGAARAAERSVDLYLDIVGEVVGGPARYEYAALLLSSAHGIAGLGLSGHLTEEKWHTDPERVLELLVDLLPDAP